MQIQSLVLTKRPVWMNVVDGYLESIQLDANVRFWPAGKMNAALLLIEFDEMPAPDTLAACKITKSALGAYVYLTTPDNAGRLLQQVSFPKVRVKRFGLQIWGHDAPIVLDDVTIAPVGADLSSAYAVSDILLNDSPELVTADGLAPLAFDLMLGNTDCNAYCHAICQNWYETMDDVARRHPGDQVGRINCSFAVEDGSRVPVTVFNGTPAMLRIPADHATYLDLIGDKARNMVRKAQRQGYAYRNVDPDDHLDDVLAIRTSDPVRQGKPIPEYYKIRPARMVDEPFCHGCASHGEGFYGVFHGERLVAYATIFFYGEIAQVNHILGHAEHLQEGIMNLLVSEMVGDIIRKRPWVKAINYLYPYSAKASSGIGLFKKNIGFVPEKVLVTPNGPDLSPYFSKHEERPEAIPIQPPSAKKTERAGTSKAVKLAASTGELIQLPKARTREKAVESALHALAARNGATHIVRCPAPASLSGTEFVTADAHAVVFDPIPFEDYQNFLSAGLKGLRAIVPKKSYLLFDFKLAPDHEHVLKSTGLAKLLPSMFESTSRRINEELIAYVWKRFKASKLSIDDVKTGFKGSDYIVTGLVEYEHHGRYDSYECLLVLQKIR
jgi:hypothetical protein